MSIVERHIAFLTKHEKQHCVASVLESAFNTRIIHTDGFDTDNLGTFDHKIQRKLPAHESALKKAYLACKLTKSNQGLGSEGSFNSLFGTSLIDQELIAFVDQKRQIEIISVAEKPMTFHVIEAQTMSELRNKFNSNAENFSEQQRWMVLVNDKWNKGITKRELLSGKFGFPLTIEPDFRAMFCPQRMEVIETATKDLVRRLTSICPKCSTPNFVAKQNVNEPAYLPCEICSQPTSKLKPPVITCDKCKYQIESSNTSKVGSAFYCSYCNP